MIAISAHLTFLYLINIFIPHQHYTCFISFNTSALLVSQQFVCEYIKLLLTYLLTYSLSNDSFLTQRIPCIIATTAESVGATVDVAVRLNYLVAVTSSLHRIFITETKK